MGEVAFSHRYGFVDKGTDVKGCIQLIDYVQLYDGLIGQVPWLHYLLLINPLVRPIFDLGLKNNRLTRMVLEELRNRNGVEQTKALKDGPNNILSQLLAAHHNAPDKFSEKDVFSVAHGAMQVT